MRQAVVGITAVFAGILVASSPVLAQQTGVSEAEAQIAATDSAASEHGSIAPSDCPPLSLNCGDASMWAHRERRMLDDRFEMLSTLRGSLEQRLKGGGPRGGMFREE